MISKGQNYYNHRKKLYASINGRKGNLVKLTKSSLLTKKEKELTLDVINSLEKLRLEIKTNKFNK